MSDKKISQLTSLAQGDVVVSTDVLPIVDTSATETKKIAVNALVGAAAAAGLTNVDINSGTIDGTTIATSDITVGSGKTLNVSAGTLTLADNQISGDKVEGGTINAITINTLTSTAVNATTVDATNVEVTNIKAKDGTAAGSIADSTGVVTLASTVLTTTDINGGTIDGTAIGASSASTGAFSTLSASGNVTLSGGTANGVLYLNGSKVATSGSTLTFDGTTLGVGVAGSAWDTLKAIDLGSGGAVYGTAAQGGITSNAYYGASGFVYKATNGAGLYQLVADSHRWSTAASGTSGTAITFAEQMRLTSTGLGIGTSSPAAKLHVVGDSLSNTFKLIANTTVSGSDATIFRPADNTMAFSTNGAERARIDSSGNLGLGVTPSAWNSNRKAIQSGNASFFSAPSAASYSAVGANVFNNTSGTDTYISSAAASLYLQNAGVHSWYTAPSGTAGNVITFTQTMTLDASGRLLIGGTSTYDFNGQANLVVNGTANNATITIASTGIGYIAFADGTSGTDRYAGRIDYDHGSNFMAFNTSAAERMRLDSSGNLGLGVTPSAFGSAYKAFQFGTTGALYGESGDAAVYLACNAFIDSAGANKYITTDFATRYNQENGVHKWLTAASGTAGNAITFTQAMTLDASGNLGVGTTSPGARLDIRQSGTTQFYIMSTSATEQNNAIVSFFNNGGSYGNLNYDGAAHIFKTSGTERARITAAGDFAVGDTTASAKVWSYKTDDGNTIGGRNTFATFAATVGFLGADRNTTNNSFYYLDCYNYGAANYRLRIADDGDVTNVNNSYGAISDVKTKQDIVDAASQWDDIKGLRVRKFRYKADPSAPLQIGLVAQEAETVSPGLIDEHPDYEEVEVTDEEGNVKTERQPTGTVTKSVKYSVLYMKSIKALQEAMARIEKLEAEVAALKGA